MNALETFALTYYKQQEIYDSRVQILVFFKRCTFLKKNFLLSLVFSHSAGVGALALVISIGRETMQWAWLTCHPPTLQYLGDNAKCDLFGQHFSMKSLDKFFMKSLQILLACCFVAAIYVVFIQIFIWFCCLLKSMCRIQSYCSLFLDWFPCCSWHNTDWKSHLQYTIRGYGGSSTGTCNQWKLLFHILMLNTNAC